LAAAPNAQYQGDLTYIRQRLAELPNTSQTS
jgi:hypothetical protein